MKTTLLSLFSALIVCSATQAADTKALTEAEAKLSNLSVATFAGGCFW